MDSSDCLMQSARWVIKVAGYVVLLVCTVIFGFMGMPAEMGLSIVAGAVALAFADIEKFSRIKGVGFEAELREKLDAVIDKETEPPELDGEAELLIPGRSKVDVPTCKVIRALQHPEYTWRYLGGIKKDTKLSSDEIKNSLSWLVDHGYVKKSLGPHGAVWNLTKEGRYLSAMIDFTSN